MDRGIQRVLRLLSDDLEGDQQGPSFLPYTPDYPEALDGAPRLPI